MASSFVSHVTVDCSDAYSLSEWWKPVLGYQDVPDDPNLPGHDECMIVDPEGRGVTVLFVEVPEGNEFCILRSLAEVEEQAVPVEADV